MISVDTDILLGLLERELAFFLRQDDSKRLLIFASRLLGWLEREARLAALLRHATTETVKAAEVFREERRQIQQALLRLWNEHSDTLSALLGSETHSPMLEIHGRFEDFESRCAAEPEPLDTTDPPAQDGTRTRRLLDSLLQWMNWTPATGGESLPAVLHDLAIAVQLLDQRQWHAFRRFQSASRCLPGAALARLRLCRDRVELAPPPTSLSESELGDWWAEHAHDVRFSAAVHSDTAQVTRDGEDWIEASVRDARHDAELLCHALRQQLLLGWSRVAILRRYAARCEAFDAARLRDLADSGGQPEAHLTRDFARYLFDQGFTPLLDPTMGCLRPDVIDTGHVALFYVEAKQYADASPRARLIAAYRQVWSTWSRLRHQRHCPEAFLVVFRRAGPLIELPAQLPHDGLILHSVLVDLAEKSGSAEKQDPIRLLPAELLPQDAVQ